MPEYTDDHGHKICSKDPLEYAERAAIFEYVCRMEVAVAINENRRVSSGKTSSGAAIVTAILRAGLLTTRPITLYRKVSQPHNQVTTGFKDVQYQHTIISTTNSSASVENWGGNYVYEITVPAGQRVIVVEHTLIGMTFLEYLLPPGYFLYSEDENYRSTNPRHRIAYMQSNLDRDTFSEFAIQQQLFQTLFPSRAPTVTTLSTSSSQNDTMQLLATAMALTRRTGSSAEPTGPRSILVGPPPSLRMPSDSEVFQTDEEQESELQRILARYPGVK